MRVAKPRKTSHREHKLTSVAENYLLAIYNLKEQGKRASLTQLAEELRRMPVSEGLGTSLPSVAAMIRRMANEGLLEMTQNKEVRLAAVGEELAEGMVRRHRLAERMVTDLLGLEMYKAHVEAHRLEHAISPDVEAKVVERLGNPTTCPFGHPIPGSGYEPPSQKLITLDKAKPGKEYIVHGIPEEDQDLLEYLVKCSFLPGASFYVEEAAPYKGVITLHVNEGEVTVGYEVASRVWVYKRDEKSSE